MIYEGGICLKYNAHEYDLNLIYGGKCGEGLGEV
jgi:hypothetical protein